jgi:hypothetical protein
MTDVHTIGPSGSTLDLLDTTKYKVFAQESAGPIPEYEYKLTGRRGSDGTLPSYDDLRAVRFEHTIFCFGGGSYQTALNNYGALAEQIRLARDYWIKGKGSVVQYTVQADDQTSASAYDVLRGEITQVRHDLIATDIAVARIQLWCSPLAKAASNTTNTSATLTNFDTYNVTVGGTEPTYAKVRVKPTTSGADRVRVTALSSEGRTPGNHLYPLLAGAVSPSGYSVALKHAQRVAQVVLTIRAKGNTGQYAPVWRSGAGTNYVGSTQTLTDAGAYATYTHTYLRNPATDLPFTIAELNAGQWGVKKVGTTEVRVTQLYAVVTYVDRDLTAQTVNRLPDADGATEQWTSTDADTYTALDDAVGADDGDTTRLTSSTDAQISLVGLQDFTTLDAADSGVRAHLQGSVGVFANGGLEATYSGPTLGSSVADEDFDDISDWSYPSGFTVLTGLAVLDSTIEQASTYALRIRSNPNYQENRDYIYRVFTGLTVGRVYQLSIYLSTNGAPSGTGAVCTVVNGARTIRMVEAATSWTQHTCNFTALTTTVLVRLSNGTVAHEAYFDTLAIKTIQSFASGWSATGTIYGGPSTDPKYEGTYAQIVGAGDTSNYVGQTVTVPTAVQYRITARLLSKYPTGGTVATATLRVVSGANTLTLTSTNASQFEEVSGVITTDGNSLTLQAYGGSGGEMFLDAVTFARVDGSDISGSELARFTLTSNLTDHYGAHKVLVAVKVTGASANLRLRYGGSDGQLIARNAVTVPTGTTVSLVEIGQLTIPETNTPAGTGLSSFIFSLYVDPSAASNAATTVDIDAVILWPVTENHVMSKPGAALGPVVNEYQVFDGLASPQAVYVADTGGSKIRSTPYEGRYVQLRPGVNRLFCLVARTATDFRRGDQFVIEVTHVDRGVV